MKNYRISTLTSSFPQENVSGCDEAVYIHWQTGYAPRGPVNHYSLEIHNHHTFLKHGGFMFKNTFALLIGVFVVAFLILNGCSNNDQPITPKDDNNAAMMTQYDDTFVDTYGEQIAQPIVPTMGMNDMRHYLGFLIRYLQLTDEQLGQIQGFGQVLHDCVSLVRQKVKDGELTDRQAIMAALKVCRDEFMTSFLGILTEEQKTKWDNLKRHRHGHGGGIAPTSGLIEEMSLKIEHNDVTIETYENSVVFGAAPVSSIEIGPRGFIGFLIRALKLTDEQIAIAKDAIIAFHTALKDIRANLKAGEITREQAKELIKAAHKTMMETIYNSLDDVQKAKWDLIFRILRRRG